MTKSGAGRKLNLSLAGLAVAIALGGSMVLLGDRAALARVLSSHGPAEAFILHARGGPEEERGNFEPAMVDLIRAALPGSDGRHLSVERIARVEVRDETDAIIDVFVRGVEAGALDMHGVVLSSGRFPGRGEPGVVVGERRKTLLRDGRIRIGASWWPVLGTIRPAGTLHDTELWCDHTALLNAIKNERSSAFYIVPDPPNSIDALTALIEKPPFTGLVTLERVPEYNQTIERFVAAERPLALSVAAVVALFVAALFVLVNALHACSAPASWAWGIAVGGGAAGVAIGALLSPTFVDNEFPAVYSPSLSASLVCVAAGIIVAIGLLASLGLRLTLKLPTER